MKQKVGVITFHEANNYGAVLQAVALQKALLKIGAEPYIINYRPNTQYGFKVSLNPHNLPYMPFIKKKERSFNSFLNKNSKLTKAVKKKDELKILSNSFDAVITGSDQVFNPKWRNGDLSYLLDFVDENKRYSYAASFGISELPEEWQNKIEPLLKKYQSVSVRETSALKLLNDMGIEGRIDCDPVLLLNKEEWLSLSKKNKLGDYLLLYTLEANDELIAFANKIAKEKSLKLIQLTDSLRKKKGNVEYFSYRSPEEFVGAFANAKYIITNSFHGLAFSTLLEKEFTVFLQNKKGAPNARLTDFVNKYAISDAVFGQGGENPHLHNFEETRKLIQDDANNSYKYLKQFGQSKLGSTKDKCIYCGACQNVCGANAISYKKDSEGNKYARIDFSKCVGCGKCHTVCPYLEGKVQNNLIKAYGFANGNIEEKLESRSGGLFYSIAKQVVKEGGVVYGAILDEKDFKVKHIRGVSIEDIKLMQKSKYVQSDDFENCIKNIIEDLKNQKSVFACGTPCFINAVNIVCKVKDINTSSLLTMDFVCHGTPTVKVFEDYINSINNNGVSSFQFRDKEKGWNTHFESYLDKTNNKQFSSKYADIFYSHEFQRPACYNCQFTNLNRPGDITGADFWGGQKIKEFSDNKGASLVLINSEKGAEAFNKYCLEDNIVKEIEIKDFMQAHLSEKLQKPSDRDLIWDLYFNKGFAEISKKSTQKANKIRKSNKRKAFIVKVLRKLHLKK